MAGEPRQASMAARAGYWICGVAWPAAVLVPMAVRDAGLCLAGEGLVYRPTGEVGLFTPRFFPPALSVLVMTAVFLQLPVAVAGAALLSHRRSAWLWGFATGLAGGWVASGPFSGVLNGAYAALAVAAPRALAEIRAGDPNRRGQLLRGWWCAAVLWWAAELSRIAILTRGAPGAFLEGLAWGVVAVLSWLALCTADETGRGARAAAGAATH